MNYSQEHVFMIRRLTFKEINQQNYGRIRLWPRMHLTLFVPHLSILYHNWKFFVWVFFTPVGNFGPNYDNYAARLVVENGHQSKKWPNLAIKMAIIKKSLLDISLPREWCPKNIHQIWNNFDSFQEIIFFVWGLGQNKFYIEQMSSVR